ncbi:MAG: quinone-dependent dihydroorotate dehydrogenase [Gammaproteobacteria bacterium]
MYRLLRPLLFALPPECAHTLTLKALKFSPACCFAKIPPSPRTVMGIKFANPIGLAAGLDKNGDYIDALAKLGFGFIEVGTVTPKPQPGHAKPRLFRLPSAQALINRMGFNNKGVDYLIARLQQAKYRGVLGINLGKNLTTPLTAALQDYQISLQKVYPYADYITINISSPNTPGLRDLQAASYLRNLLAGIKQTQQQMAQKYQRQVPIAVKVSPDLTETEVETLAHTLLEYKIEGVIATNTTSMRDGVQDLALAKQTGGLSGKPLSARSTQVIKLLHQHLQDNIPIIAVGGIMDRESAQEKMNAGASLLQLYSGLVYRGPALIKQIARP